MLSLRWRRNEHDGVSNHQPHHCLLNHLFGCRSNKTSKLRVTGLCAGNSPGTGEFPTQMASNAENVSIWWRHHGIIIDRVIRMFGCTYNYCCACCAAWYEKDFSHCRPSWICLPLECVYSATGIFLSVITYSSVITYLITFNIWYFSRVLSLTPITIMISIKNNCSGRLQNTY